MKMNFQRVGNPGCIARLEHQLNKRDIVAESPIDNVRAILLTNVSVWSWN